MSPARRRGPSLVYGVEGFHQIDERGGAVGKTLTLSFPTKSANEQGANLGVASGVSVGTQARGLALLTDGSQYRRAPRQGIRDEPVRGFFFPQ